MQKSLQENLLPILVFNFKNLVNFAMQYFGDLKSQYRRRNKSARFN